MSNCSSKFFMLFFMCFYALLLGAQTPEKNNRQQILLVTENDSYTFKIIDRYYTNGIALRFSKALLQAGKKKKILKLITFQNLTSYLRLARNFEHNSCIIRVFTCRLTFLSFPAKMNFLIFFKFRHWICF